MCDAGTPHGGLRRRTGAYSATAPCTRTAPRLLLPRKAPGSLWVLGNCTLRRGAFSFSVPPEDNHKAVHAKNSRLSMSWWLFPGVSPGIFQFFHFFFFQYATDRKQKNEGRSQTGEDGEQGPGRLPRGPRSARRRESPFHPRSQRRRWGRAERRG